jgi:hypothetical protein
MNKYIKSAMFTIPVTVYPVGNKDSVGDREVGTPYEILGYVYDEDVVLTNYLGEKELSTRQVYLPEDDITDIPGTYLISCLDNHKSHIIKRQEFRGRHGKTLIGVLYLP